MREREGDGVKACHWGTRNAFCSGGLVFYGAGSNRGLCAGDMDVIIDCGADIEGCEEFSGIGNITSRDYAQQIIRIEWPDGGIPALAEENWRTLIGDLRGLRLRIGRDALHVMVCCVGGHGRTGTALAILAALTGVAPEDPVTFIRTNYCPRAVETKSQCRYVKTIAGLNSEDDLPPPEFDKTCESSLR
ncbi:MAG: hypothetical protein HZB33_14985 [Nitrospirae bacterium]|nr:hypothetical protein [Nitrospirota bacterium]